eukprot:Skav226874  [mRNA]  locus=scaffold1187:205759:209608:+ [translate_table: standard]
MLSVPLLFALLTLSVAHGDISDLKGKNLSEVTKPAKTGGPSDVWSRLNKNPLVKQAEEETSRAWNAVAQDVLHMFSELTNSTPANAIGDGGHPEIAWNIGAVVVAALAVLLPVGCCGFCLWAHANQTLDVLQQRPGYSLLLPEVSDLKKVLRLELPLMLACPILALMAGPWTTCATGCPTWIYVLYLPILLRSKWVEQALACDLQGADISNRFAGAWANSSAAWLAPVVQSFHVSGLIFLAFCVGAAAQQWIGTLLPGDALLADLCGMHGLAQLRGRMSDKLLLVAISKLLLQSSFFALVFDTLTPLGRAKVLFSILLGLLSASQKILEAMSEWVKQICRKPARDREGWCVSSIVLVIFMAPFTLALLFVLWTLAKLYFVFHCETHLWNFGSGCVEWT